ncbi:Monomeric sarcosine oxidase [Frankliniella fusca]|uniref:Monomeric sarcosine oxidase n=1 Tax=Frankliniella fusca TaxID=407009 RepID=A0AAE1HXA6_9NEOP|nr:Monomeric sarcosine oxidase [Frankliniella fusca]
MYKPKQVVLFDVDDVSLFMFAEIEIIIVKCDKPIFICSYLETIGYFAEVRGYEVKRMSDKINWFAFDQEKLLDPSPLCMYKMSSGESVVVLKKGKGGKIATSACGYEGKPLLIL